ncbi:MAG: AAA family ATPase [Pirellulales bacterium]|nr:AAA family ATPase [Pirellulales bacterium]
MSPLDAAFIKAYGLSDAAKGASSDQIGSSSRTVDDSVAVAASVASRPATAAADCPTTPDDSPLDLRIDHAHPMKRPRATFQTGTDRLLDDVIAASGSATTVATTDRRVADAPGELSTTDAGAEIQPAFYVDRFVWPAVCRQLLSLRRATWNDLVDQLRRGLLEGRRVLAIAPAKRGSGATTLSLTLALALAEQGVRAVIVDGDWDDPQLATRLGLAPQVGWDDLDETQLDPSGVLIESTSDRLALLPCRQPLMAALADLPYHAARMVHALRTNYDLVLIDTGPVDSSTVPWQRVWHRSLVDGVIVVERAGDVASHSQHALTADHMLSAAGIAWWGVAETFASR